MLVCVSGEEDRRKNGITDREKCCKLSCATMYQPPSQGCLPSFLKEGRERTLGRRLTTIMMAVTMIRQQ